MTTPAQFKNSLEQIFYKNSKLNNFSLEEILAPVPRIDKLDLPEGTRVLIRCDLDVPLADGKVADLSRLESIGRTVTYARDKNWIPILFGHLGRDPEATLKPVADALSNLINSKIEFVGEWIDNSGGALEPCFRDNIDKFSAGQVVMLENTRRYEIERIMWKLRSEEFDSVVRPLYSLATEICENVSAVLVNEALAASNFDFSSSVLPLVMDKVALGFHINTELREHVSGARESALVVFSGLKIDKLDNLENIVDRGKVRMIISAGSLAMALKKAQAQLDGGDFHLGLAQEDENAKSFIPEERIEQARRIIQKCRDSEIDVVLPIDFVLDDGTVSGEIPEDRLQFDIGSKTRVLFSLKVDEFANSGENLTMFYNGVFGKFEDERFENGTKSFIGELKSLTERGALTYVGGGEGRMALLKYGKLDDVTHAFNAGGTILKSLGNKHIAYLKAGYLACIESDPATSAT